jgi:hypothetical protein
MKGQGKPWTCPQCGRKFGTASSGAQHMASKHRQPITAKVTVGGKRGQSTRLGLSQPGGNLAPISTPESISARMPGSRLRAADGSLALPPMGTTLAGRNWAARAAHPCSSSMGGAYPIPDATDTDSVSVELRSTITIGAPAGTTNTWGGRLVFPPMSDLPAIVQTNHDGGALSQAVPLFDITTTEAAYRPGVFKLGSGSQEPSYESTPGLYSVATQIRRGHAGCTVFLNANSLTDQGLITAGQYGNKPSQANAKPILVGYLGLNQSEVTYLNLRDIPRTTEQLVRQCPEAYIAEAREGVYMPFHFNDPTHLWTDGATSEWTSPGDLNKRNTGQVVTLSDVGQEVAQNLSSYVTVPGTLTNEVVTSFGVVNSLTGVVLFEGLDPKATLFIKMQHGIELVAESDSPLAQAQKASPPDDEVARKAVHAVQRELPHAFPHRYNSLGLLAPWIARAAQAVLPAVAPWLYNKASGFLSSIAGGGRSGKRMTAPSRMQEVDLD